MLTSSEKKVEVFLFYLVKRGLNGVLPMKVKDEIILKDWVYKIVIPTKLKEQLETFILDNLKDKVIYVENDYKDIWDWSEKVYRIIENFMIKKIDEQNISECVNVIRVSFTTLRKIV